MTLKKLSSITTICTTLLATGCSVFGVRSEEQPAYEVIDADGDKEIRRYDSYIVAKATVNGDFEQAQREGFRILANYIFGGNRAKQKIAMTSPVVQEEAASEKIAMTAPVTIKPSQDRGAKKAWTITFSMPSQYSLETLPEPIDGRVQVQQVDQQYLAAITYTGFWSQSKNEQKANELLSWLATKTDYKSESAAMFAGYNPPWTLPFLRRNEMLIVLTKQQRSK